ncbi:LysE family transporter [candidate division KSB1 bacterium]|nr:LysE family transporter [candidate division KSB1 bacterium]
MYIIVAIIVGFIAAVPIGPINVFAISQTLKRDFLHGFLVGITSAVMDIIFCIVAISGMYHVVSNLEHLLPFIKLFGVFVLLLISVRLIFQAQKFNGEKEKQKKMTTAPRPIIGAFLLYITNPGLYAFWLAVGGTATAHGLVRASDASFIIFSLFCGVGTAIWYFALCRYVSKYHHYFKQSTFKKILLATAIILLAIAIYTLGTVFI